LRLPPEESVDVLIGPVADPDKSSIGSRLKASPERKGPYFFIAQVPLPNLCQSLHHDTPVRQSTEHLSSLRSIHMDFLLELDLVVVCLVALAFTFFVVKAAYRSFFHPLAKFPGPWTAAISKLYEGYHVLVKNDWLENLEALHKKHGKLWNPDPPAHCLN